jgi:hypothetical protein
MQGEPTSFAEHRQSIIDSRQRIRVFLCHRVELTEVTTESNRTILLRNKKNRRVPRTRRGSNDSILKHRFNFLLYDIMLMVRHAIRRSTNGSMILSVNGMCNDRSAPIFLRGGRENMGPFTEQSTQVKFSRSIWTPDGIDEDCEELRSSTA